MGGGQERGGDQQGREEEENEHLYNKPTLTTVVYFTESHIKPFYPPLELHCL